MNNKVKAIDIKSCAYNLFNDIVNMQNFNPNNFKIDEKSYENIILDM